MTVKNSELHSAPAMKKRLAAGESLRFIAEELGVSTSTVWRYKRRLGLGALNSAAIPEHDTSEQIRLCLECTRPVCPGSCRVIRAAARMRS